MNHVDDNDLCVTIVNVKGAQVLNKQAIYLIFGSTLLIGGIAMWYFFHPVVSEKKTDVLGIANEKKQIDISSPAKSFEEAVLPVTPLATPTAIITNTITKAVSNQQVNQKGPYPMEIDIKKSYEAVLKTSKGDITIALAANATPITVNNFVSLARKSFYNNTIFHRIIKGFMIQGGDPKGDGTGGPGYQFADEPFVGEYTRGTIAMANAGPNTNGSQFFIMHANYPLPKNYVIFGHVTNGLEVVDAIATSSTKPSGEGSSPVTPVVVSAIDIVEK